MGIILLAALLVIPPAYAALPADVCEEVKESLVMGVDEGLITNEEATWIYEGCGRWVERGGLTQD